MSDVIMEVGTPGPQGRGFIPSDAPYDGTQAYLRDSIVRVGNTQWRAKQDVPAGHAPAEDAYWTVFFDGDTATAESVAAANLAKAWAAQPVGEDVEGAPAGSRSALDRAAASLASANLSQAWSSQPVGEDVAGAAPGSRSAFHWATTAANTVAAGLTSISDAVSNGLTSISNAVSGGLSAISSTLSDAISSIGTALSGATSTISTAGSSQVGNVNTAGTNQTNAVNAAAAAQLNSISQAIGAKFYASTADALSKGLASVTLGAGGSGATVTGQFPVGTTNGGGTQGLFLVNVAGGSITSIVKILNPGRGYTSAPTTFDTSAIAGLTGATFTATIGQNRNVGEYFATPSTTPALFDFYVVATSTSATLLGSGPDFASVNELRNAGGNRNLHPDPFNIESAVTDGLRGRRDISPYMLGTGWTIEKAPAGSPYQGGKVLHRGSAAATWELRWTLDQLEDPILPGDTIEFGAEIAADAAGGAAVQNVFSYAFYGREGTIIGAGTTIASTSGNPLDTTFRLFRTGAVVVPANAAVFRIVGLWTGAAQGQYWASLQLCRGSISTKPVQRLPVPDLGNRLRTLELNASANPVNNVLMRRTAYASAVSNLLVGTGTPLGSNLGTYNGAGSNFLAAAWPASGINAISQTWKWAPSETAGAARITVIVRTAATGVNCLNRGKVIAWGWIDCDPSTGSAGSEPILLLDPNDPTNQTVKTVTSADLLDLFSLSHFATTKSGADASFMYSDLCSTFQYVDTAATGVWKPAATTITPYGKFGPAYSSLGGVSVWYPKLLLLTSPVVATRTPSATFAGAIAASSGDLVPDLAALPPRIWNVANMETWLYFFGMQHRPPSRTNFETNYSWAGTYPANKSGQFEEGVRVIETAAGTKTMTLKASIGGTLFATKTTSIKTAAANANSGTTRRVLIAGSSLVQNGTVNTALQQIVANTAINTGGAATGMNVVGVGTRGTYPNQNEGYSGQGISVFFNPTISGSALPGGINPFYNGGTFDFTYYVNTYLGGVPPTDFVAGDPYWSVASAADDAAAAAAAVSCANYLELMIASIAAWNNANPGSPVNTLVWFPPHQPEFGQDGEARSMTATIMQHQRNRNLREAAKLYCTQFGVSREADRIFALGFNVVGNPLTAVSRYPLEPLNAAVRAKVSTVYGPYASKAAMVAAVGGIPDGTIVSDGSTYWVRDTAVGGFRQPTLEEGFVSRIIDSTHGIPAYEMAQQMFACMKNNP